MRIGVAGSTNDFGDDVSATSNSHIQTFQNENRCAFAHDRCAAPPPLAEVSAKPSPKRAAVIVNARLLRRPTPDEMRAAYPPRALSQGVEGRATMACSATVEGTLSDCSATSETPPGYRFGQAAVAVASRYRVSPRTVDGEAVASPVDLTLTWTLN